MVSGERSGWWSAGFTPRRVMIVAALFIVGYFSLSIASNAITHTRLAGREAALEKDIRFLEQREARLNALRTYMENDAFVEAAARENGLVYPGETAVIQVGQDPAAQHEGLGPGDPWWYRYLHPEDRP
jgi:cell division protein FtsB